MGDDDKATRGQPALATAAASWVSNKAAERTGRLSWPLAAAFFLASAAAAALPFAAGRWRESAFLADIQNYDGLGAAFMAMAEHGNSWSVAGGALSTKGSGPAVFEAGAWATVVGQAGSPAPDSGKVLWFGSDRLVISNPESGAAIASSWEPFEGLSSDTVATAADDYRDMADLIGGIIHTAVYAGLPSAVLTLTLLMLVQNLFFVAIMGVFLSLAELRRQPGFSETKAKPAPLAGIKTSVFLCAGPAFLAGLVGLAVPAVPAPMAWLAYSLLAGLRVVLLYMSRYRQAASPVL